MTGDEGGTAPDRDHEDAPIVELAALFESAPPDFVGRVHRSIERRLLVGQIVEVASAWPLEVLVELVGIAFGLAGGGTGANAEKERDD